MVALPTDVTRSGSSAKVAFEAVFKAMVSVLERGMSAGVSDRHALAQATAALCVGGMVVARAMEDRASADELREACMRVAFGMGGWDGERVGNDQVHAAAR
ncbi:MAG: hypothetical protein ABSF53_21695, partial [Terracidiphilus sp.]